MKWRSLVNAMVSGHDYSPFCDVTILISIFLPLFIYFFFIFFFFFFCENAYTDIMAATVLKIYPSRKHAEAVLTSTHNLRFEQKYEKH